MLFNSPVFLFVFLPLTLLSYFISAKPFKNLVLIIASFIFYFWGQGNFIYVLVAMILANHLLASLIKQNLNKKQVAKKYLFFAILLNIFFLAYFKYRVFLLVNVLHVFKAEQIPLLSVPLAISFFTFHAISYNVDVFRGISQAEKKLSRITLYFMFFPHLLAGPILRYHQIQNQLGLRQISIERFVIAIKRFAIGFAKKVLIADQLGTVVNEIFAIPPHHLDPSVAWLGIICFTLQIYFDFSGYTDMAIGLAKMFGFDFPENFNYPYISSSIREFWRRWHITLSNWLRDYIYIPLGGNRISNSRTYFNLLIVFLVCGIWHGAGWTFIIWGMIHGIFSVLERVKGGILVNWMWWPLKHLYALTIIIFSWVFFRSESFDYAIGYIKLLLGLVDKGYVQYRSLDYFLTNEIMVILLVAIIVSMPVYPKIRIFINHIKTNNYAFVPVELAKIVFFAFLFLASISVVAAQTYRSFLYFRF